MARKPKVQTRLPNDTYDRLTEYQEERDISEADATRRLIETGLDAADADDSLRGQFTDTQAINRTVRRRVPIEFARFLVVGLAAYLGAGGAL
jgi:hypothetical protein